MLIPIDRCPKAGWLKFMGIRAIYLHAASAAVAVAITSVPAFAQPIAAADERAAILAITGTWDGVSAGAGGHHFRIVGQEIQFENCKPLPFEFVATGRWKGFPTVTIKFAAPGDKFPCLWDGPILTFTFTSPDDQGADPGATDQSQLVDVDAYDSLNDFRNNLINSGQTFNYSP